MARRCRRYRVRHPMETRNRVSLTGSRNQVRPTLGRNRASPMRSRHPMAENDDAREGLARHRKAIDGLDQEILERLNARAAHAQAIGAIKGHGAAYRPEREN